jgi:hypothetical protein
LIKGENVQLSGETLCGPRIEGFPDVPDMTDNTDLRFGDLRWISNFFKFLNYEIAFSIYFEGSTELGR